MEGLRVSDCLIVLYSKNAVGSHDMLDEIQEAHTTNKRIIPFLLDDTPLVNQFRYYLARKQWIVAYPNYKNYLEGLLLSLKGEFKSNGIENGSNIDITQTIKKPIEIHNSDNEIELQSQQEVIENGVGPHKIIQWIIFAISIIAIVLASIFEWRHFHHTAPLNPIAIEDTICSPIDLDLPSGTLWADRNVGAQMSTDFGDLFAWGETEPKNDYSRYNYVEQLMPSIQISKAKHDAALSQLGPDWSMPTEKQFQELLSECTWKWAQMNGNKGYKITGKNGQQIFLPAAGCSHDTS